MEGRLTDIVVTRVDQALQAQVEGRLSDMVAARVDHALQTQVDGRLSDMVAARVDQAIRTQVEGRLIDMVAARVDQAICTQVEGRLTEMVAARVDQALRTQVEGRLTEMVAARVDQALRMQVEGRLTDMVIDRVHGVKEDLQMAVRELEARVLTKHTQLKASVDATVEQRVKHSAQAHVEAIVTQRLDDSMQRSLQSEIPSLETRLMRKLGAAMDARIAQAPDPRPNEFRDARVAPASQSHDTAADATMSRRLQSALQSQLDHLTSRIRGNSADAKTSNDGAQEARATPPPHLQTVADQTEISRSVQAAVDEAMAKLELDALPRRVEVRPANFVARGSQELVMELIKKGIDEVRKASAEE